MLVRLGFAVAAHLDPEILVVDEVLAVGDAEFQKKAIGKMQDVSSGEGRTVLFVSHNMASIAKLCKQCILLDKGSILRSGDTQDIINAYVSNANSHNLNIDSKIEMTEGFCITRISFEQYGTQNDKISQGSPFSMSFVATNELDFDCALVFNMEVSSEQAQHITCFGNEFQDKEIVIQKHSQILIRMSFDEMLLKSGTYYLTTYFLISNKSRSFTKDYYLEFAKKFIVDPPSPLFYSSPNRIWKSFPCLPQHGNLNMEVNDFTVEDISD